MRKLLFAAICWLLLGPPAMAQPPTEAQATLVERGVMKGYSDGTFRGPRAITRAELVTTLERLEQVLDRQHSGLATKKDLNQARRAVGAVREENDTLQQRVTELENEVDLDRRRADEFWF